MGHLSHFVHWLMGKKSIAKESKYDAEKLANLLEKNFENYPEKRSIARKFSKDVIDSTLLNVNAVFEALTKMEGLISKELVNIDEEERDEKEVLADLEIMISSKSREEIFKLNDQIVLELEKQAAFVKLFAKIHDALKLELHVIRIVLKNPKNIKELLINLFSLVYNREDDLYTIFMRKSFGKDEDFQKIKNIANKFILEARIEKEIQSEEDKFIGSMVKAMSNEESKHRYRILGEDIFDMLLEEAGAPWSTGNEFEKGFKLFDELVQNDKTLYDIINKIIKSRHLKYTDAQIPLIMKAFRKSFDLGHFVNLESGFAT